MANADSNESPLERVAETIDGWTSDAFELLGNETRLAILLALWEAHDPDCPRSERREATLSFSELRDRVGLHQGSQFNYHLNKLKGSFVDQTDEGYTLTRAANQILHAILAGTLTDEPSFEGEPIDSECRLCGAAAVIDYRDRTLIKRCTNCEGAIQTEDDPSGTLGSAYYPSVGLLNRTPQEFFRHSMNWHYHRMFSMIEGTCLDCSGNVTPSVYICANHNTEGRSICERCQRHSTIEWVFTCEVCKYVFTTPGYIPIIGETAVVMFFYEHGVDPLGVDESWFITFANAIEQTEVQSEEPLEIEVIVGMDGDRLVVRLDEEANVIDVTEGIVKSD